MEPRIVHPNLFLSRRVLALENAKQYHGLLDLRRDRDQNATPPTPPVVTLSSATEDDSSCFFDERPPPAPVTFQILEVIVENSAAHPFDLSNADGSEIDVRSLMNTPAVYEPHGTDEAAKRRFFNTKGPSVVYLFGVNLEGQSVTVAVSGFRPWLFIELSRVVDRTLVLQLCRDLATELRVDHTSITASFALKKRVYGWVPASDTDALNVREFWFARVEVPNPAALRAVAALLDQHNLRVSPNADLSPEDLVRKTKCVKKPLPSLRTLTEKVVTSETRVQSSEKFLAFNRLTPSSWVTVAAFEEVDLSKRVTVSQHELSCNCAALHAETSVTRLSTMIIAAVDIEVQSSDYRSFPTAKKDGDRVTFIGTTFWRYGDKEPRLRVMQVLGACDPVPGILIESYDTEETLLLGWRDLIAIRANPDQVVSYNGTGFDFAYLAERHDLIQQQLKAMNVLQYSRFTHLGRLLFQSAKLVRRDVSSAGMGQNEISEFPMSGRLQLDLFQYVKLSQKLSSYKLDDVCKVFLKDTTQGKVVLDFPGWVAQLTSHATEAMRATASHVLDESSAATPFTDEGTADAQVPRAATPTPTPTFTRRRTPSSASPTPSPPHSVSAELHVLYATCVLRCDHAVAAAKHAQVQKERAGDAHPAHTDPGEDDDDTGAAKGPWAAVHENIEAATDALGKMVELLGEPRMFTEVRALLDTHVQPALDASGVDNYRKLFRMYDGTSAHRAKIASYCQVDCDLVLLLMDRINVLPNNVQMSQVTYTLLNDISSRGQQIKTFNLIARHSFDGGYVMNFRHVGWDPAAEYEGATVLPPCVGYYERPVVTLDFASLYPSIMQAYNLCFSSIVLDDQYAHMEAYGARYGRYEIAGKTWTFQEHHTGLLPQILASLVHERRVCKKEMKKYEKGSLDYKLADGKQLALKVSCNSVYGFTGVTNNGMFPCMPVAVATTYNGRALIQQTKEFVEANYNATVIYGDTDSVMLQFPGVDTVASAFLMAGRVARECTATFRDVLSLEFEKVYCPYLLIRKKHYAGMKYEDNPNTPPVLDAKGLALVRRDNCQMVRTAMRQILHATMRDGNPAAAYAIVRDQINQLVERRVDLKDLEISNAYKTGLQTDHHPHVQVVKNMEARHAFGIPRVGDRVPYVIIEGAKKSNVYERAEHPRHVADTGLKVDLEYYLRNQLQQRLEKVLTPLPIPSVTALFDEASREISRRRSGLRRLDFFFRPTVPRASPPATDHTLDPPPGEETPARTPAIPRTPVLTRAPSSRSVQPSRQTTLCFTRVDSPSTTPDGGGPLKKAKQQV